LPATEAKSAATSLITSLRCSRQEQQFETFWTNALSEAQTLEVDDPVFPRCRRPSVHIDSGAAGVTYESPEDYYRAIYYEFSACATSCVSDRFDQETFGIYENPESVLINAINCKKGEPVDMAQRLNDVTEHFTTDLDRSKLKSQLSILAGSIPDEHSVHQPLIPYHQLNLLANAICA